MKKLSKLHLSDVEHVKLSEAQMKQVTGGYNNQEKLCDSTCTGSCTVYIFGVYTSGHCEYTSASGHLVCGCRIY